MAEEEERDEEKFDSQDVNKTDYVYTINTIHQQTNPFFVNAKIFDRQVACLLDTGADTSIIHEEWIPEQYKQEKYNGSVRSACGSRMQIHKRISNVAIGLLQKKIQFSPVITSTEPRYSILGADVLTKFPELLMEFYTSTNHP